MTLFHGGIRVDNVSSTNISSSLVFDGIVHFSGSALVSESLRVLDGLSIETKTFAGGPAFQVTASNGLTILGEFLAEPPPVEGGLMFYSGSYYLGVP